MHHINSIGKSCVKVACTLSLIIAASIFLFFAMLHNTENASEESVDYVVGLVHDVSYRSISGRSDHIYFQVNEVGFVMQWLGSESEGRSVASDLQKQTESICVASLSNRKLWSNKIAISVQAGSKQYGDLVRFNQRQISQRRSGTAAFLVLWVLLLFGLWLCIYILYQQPRPSKFSGILGFVKWFLLALFKKGKR